jgi:hypothetical protein
MKYLIIASILAIIGIGYLSNRYTASIIKRRTNIEISKFNASEKTNHSGLTTFKLYIPYIIWIRTEVDTGNSVFIDSNGGWHGYLFGKHLYSFNDSE